MCFLRFRLKVHSITTSPYFENTILFVIFLSSIALALEDPVVENSEINKLLKYFDYVFTTIFGLECILRVREEGAVNSPRARRVVKLVRQTTPPSLSRFLTWDSSSIPALTSAIRGTLWTPSSFHAPSRPSLFSKWSNE